MQKKHKKDKKKKNTASKEADKSLCAEKNIGDRRRPN